MIFKFAYEVISYKILNKTFVSKYLFLLYKKNCSFEDSCKGSEDYNYMKLWEPVVCSTLPGPSDSGRSCGLRKVYLIKNLKSKNIYGSLS